MSTLLAQVTCEYARRRRGGRAACTVHTREGLKGGTQGRDTRKGHLRSSHTRRVVAPGTMSTPCRASQAAERGAAGASDEELLSVLEPAMYLPLVGDEAAAWVQWLRRWLRAQEGEGGGGAEAARRMRLVSPKYIPREWMLAEAYTGAELCGKQQPPRGFGQFASNTPSIARSSSGQPPASASLGPFANAF